MGLLVNHYFLGRMDILIRALLTINVMSAGPGVCLIVRAPCDLLCICHVCYSKLNIGTLVLLGQLGYKISITKSHYFHSYHCNNSFSEL